jgi:hypothetical protein
MSFHALPDRLRSIRLAPAVSLVALAAALSAASLSAAPTVNTRFGDTRVTLSAEFTGALASLQVTPSTVFPTRLRSGVVDFPITAGEIDLQSLKGEVVHDGGLNLRAGSTTVTLSSFVIDTTGSAPVLTGLVKANDSVVGRLPLFDITLNRAPSVQERGAFDVLGIENASLALNAEAAAALNGAFNVNAFSAAIPIGTARVHTLVYDPDLAFQRQQH